MDQVLPVTPVLLPATVNFEAKLEQYRVDLVKET